MVSLAKKLANGAPGVGYPTSELILYNSSVAKKKFANPFYALVVVAGIAFTVTACAYGVLVVRGLRPPSPTEPAPTGLLKFLDQHGAKLLMGELGVLAAASFLAMGTDK